MASCIKTGVEKEKYIAKKMYTCVTDPTLNITLAYLSRFVIVMYLNSVLANNSKE